MIMKTMTANLRIAAAEAVKRCYDRTLKNWTFSRDTQVFRYRNNEFAVLPVSGKHLWRWQVFQSMNGIQWVAIGASFTYRPVYTYKHDAPQLHTGKYCDDMVSADTKSIWW